MVSVQNTTVDPEHMREQVFTNIDSGDRMSGASLSNEHDRTSLRKSCHTERQGMPR
jgi:hypothetical protein